MASQLRVDKILPVDGAPTGGGGGIIQVVSAINTSATVSIDFAAETYNNYDDASLKVTITPKFSTSKMLITVHTVAQISGNRARFDIHKSTTNSRLSGNPSDDGTNYGISAFEGANINHAVFFNIMDIAGTTSNIRYKLQFLNAGGNTVYIQGNYSVGTLTVMELSA